MAVTIQQIAERAGVSRGTVDRALNHRGRINPEVAEKICRLADEMGYVQKERKRSRTAKDERLKIGVVTQLARSSFMQEVNRGIEKAAQELKEKGALQTRLTIEDFIASFTAEYYNFVQQTLRLENFRYAMALSRERLRIAEAWYHVGSSAQLDVLQARVDFNADSSQYMSQQEAVVASRIRINELLANEELDRRFLVRDTVIAIDDALQWDVLVAETRTANAELLMADRDNAISELELQSIRSRNYPYLNLTAGYGYTHNRYGSGTTRMRGQLGLNAGLQVGFTIFDGNRRRELRNARIAVQNARLEREQLEQALRADLSNLWQAYQNNLQMLKLERQNLVAAKENHEIAMERYMLGNLSGIEMREAQKSLLDAEERILSAEYDTKLCEISLLQISGRVEQYLE